MVHKRKIEYKAKLIRYLQEHKTIIVVTCDHVGSHQLQKVRQDLRGRALVLMGKNTLVRMVLREYMETDPEIEKFLPSVRGNCGFIFTNDDVKEIRDIVLGNRLQSIARPGVIAPNDVTVPPGPTGLDPGQTSFFQALNIATKIFKGQIEITSKVFLIKKGAKVGNSECALLNKLDIKPFEYGLVVTSIFTEGASFGPEVLDLTNDDLIKSFFNAVRVVAALGLRIGIPNISSIPHSFANGFRKLLALSVQTDYTFEAAKPYKEYLTDPAAYQAAHGGPSVAAEESPAAEEKAAEEEPEEDESSEGGPMGLFGDDSDSDSE
uniref:60S acidic ribosomal protein P0 n=1 Tax=Hirondellea gigas TaxID=1518452 RepID=A0A6A7FW56_9CRUS